MSDKDQPSFDQRVLSIKHFFIIVCSYHSSPVPTTPADKPPAASWVRYMDTFCDFVGSLLMVLVAFDMNVCIMDVLVHNYFQFRSFFRFFSRPVSQGYPDYPVLAQGFSRSRSTIAKKYHKFLEDSFELTIRNTDYKKWTYTICSPPIFEPLSSLN